MTHLKHCERGRRFVYSPVRSRRREASSALNRLVRVFYEGSFASAVAGMIGNKDAKLSDEELGELAGMIARARRKGPKK